MKGILGDRAHILMEECWQCELKELSKLLVLPIVRKSRSSIVLKNQL